MSRASAEDAPWRVEKASGEVWVTTAGAQAVSLSDQTELKSGDAIRTGKSGRVLLTRGNETMLLSPNTAIALPQEAKDGMTTTIEQAAGSILLDVEHRDVQHFEVVTPYLAAVVKGTQFRVTLNGRGAHVDVNRGQVQVSDFKTGQYALVLPGQTGSVGLKGSSGLSLSGTGALGHVEQGQPRTPDVKPIHIEHGSLPPPSESGPAKVLRLINAKNDAPQSGAAPHHFVLLEPARPNANHVSGTRITSPLGEVHVDFQKVTNGLAREASQHATAKNGEQRGTIWSSSGASNGSGYGNGNVNVGVNGATTTASPSSAGSAGVNAQIGAANKGQGNGNGNGNGNGHGSGNENGNGNGNGNGHGHGHG